MPRVETAVPGRRSPGTVPGVRVLGIDVDDVLLGRWRGWLMPARQPYRVPPGLARELAWRTGRTC
ncbi:hypothetical protein GCM10022220_24020 [Actinocatenispora rupis]|uniref:Uncharacterized protein n=1 Tax=Actinocatenispora rupis TaxID=519421 RepID=A0A8J3J873_9ACTN|nr:hypothetical protein Aru02nite_28260 [Actinocatenispora rupis]